MNGAAGGTKSTTVTPEKRGGTTRVGNITAMVMIGKEMDEISGGISGEMRNPEGNPHSPAKGHPPPPAHQKKGEGFSSSGNNKAHQLTQRN